MRHIESLRHATYSPLRPIAAASLHRQTLLIRSQLYLAEFRNTHRLIRHISDVILAAQFLLKLREYGVQALFFRNFEESAARLPRHAHQDAAAVGLAKPAVEALIREENRIDQRVGLLRGFDSIHHA